jgi:4-hydroxy-4-methyl-2-oxoglutarate aldolase
MALASWLTEGELDALRRFDTCMVANAVESFNVRLHNTGFTNASIHCMFKNEPPMVDYAATARLSSGEAPMVGSTFHDRGDFWNSILQIPPPRILVLEDKDPPSRGGAFVGDMHSANLKALGCIGYLTNGAVRELPSVRAMGIQLSFRKGCCFARLCAHFRRRGAAISVGGLEIRPGDLLHRDRRGVLTVPAEIARALPAVAAEMQPAEQKVIDSCRSNAFSGAKLGRGHEKARLVRKRHPRNRSENCKGISKEGWSKKR